jgi:hypothetical protein
VDCGLLLDVVVLEPEEEVKALTVVVEVELMHIDALEILGVSVFDAFTVLFLFLCVLNHLLQCHDSLVQVHGHLLLLAVSLDVDLNLFHLECFENHF